MHYHNGTVFSLEILSLCSAALTFSPRFGRGRRGSGLCPEGSHSGPASLGCGRPPRSPAAWPVPEYKQAVRQRVEDAGCLWMVVPLLSMSHTCLWPWLAVRTPFWSKGQQGHPSSDLDRPCHTLDLRTQNMNFDNLHKHNFSHCDDSGAEYSCNVITFSDKIDRIIQLK